MSLIVGGCLSSKTEEAVVKKIGTIQTKIGDEYVLSNNEETVNITSNKVDLEQYMKKKVRVEGQYSGSTIYVDKIELSN